MRDLKYISPVVALAMMVNSLAPLPVVFAQEADTDGDGIPDIREDINGNGFRDEGETDPYRADTDGGGESDGSEIKAGRNPLDKTDDLTYDADGDGWINMIELLRGTDPYKMDTDGDGVNDPEDPFPLDPRYSRDANANGIPDEWEEATGLDKPGVDNSARGDPDNDGLDNSKEFANGTDPLSADTDRDGIPDAEELLQQTDPKESSCLSYGTFGEPFADIRGHWAEEYVFRLQRTLVVPANTPIVRGYGSIGDTREASFDPNRPVSRFEFLKMLLLSTCTKLNDKTIEVPVRFGDVLSIPPQMNEPPDQKLRRQVVYTAVQYGIVQGYEDGTFRPDSPINRAEALKMLILASQLPATEELKSESIPFPDVKQADWFAQYVRFGLWYGIISGYQDGTFKPENSITRAEAAKIVYTAMLVNPYVNGYVLPSLEDDADSVPAAPSSASGSAVLPDLTPISPMINVPTNIVIDSPDAPQPTPVI